VQVRDRYGNPPLDYLAWNKQVTPFQQQVAEEARYALETAEALEAPAEGLGRVVDGPNALRLLMSVQKYSLWFNDFTLAETRQLVQGAFGMRMLVSRFQKGDTLLRRAEAATCFGVLLEGELGLRQQADGSGFPRRLHKGALFGERGLFDAGLRAADLVAVSDGSVATLLYSELEQLGASFPDLMRKLNLQLAKAAIEEQLGDASMSLDDLGDVELQRQVKEMLKRQQRGQWGAQHKALRELREGLYADIADEAEKLFGADPREANKRSGSRLGKVKALLSKSPSPPRSASGSKKG
jgi:CRP-like cAMP-binding protein